MQMQNQATSGLVVRRFSHASFKVPNMESKCSYGHAPSHTTHLFCELHPCLKLHVHTSYNFFRLDLRDSFVDDARASALSPMPRNASATVRVGAAAGDPTTGRGWEEVL